ncbi:hypothetical protein CASFOL_006350 [Castilleja foliolosa]|uniref:Uncharacterized protein n=1 Tax=Castilleja foliolosa TaxID=1961234 RepID=A0ABD3E6P9_9LAMI
MLFSQPTLFPYAHNFVDRKRTTNNLFNRLYCPTQRRNVENGLPVHKFAVLGNDILDCGPHHPGLVDALLAQLDLVIGHVFEDGFVFVALALAVAHQYDALREVLLCRLVDR